MRINVEDTLFCLVDVQDKLYPHVTNKDEIEKNLITLIKGLKVLSVPFIINEQYKKQIGEKLLEDVKENLLKIIKSTLNNITAFKTGARSKHVHYERFLDEELKWLSSTNFLSNFHDEFKIESEKAYIMAKDKWYKLIKNNNEELKKLLDIYFNAIHTIIAIDNKVILPQNTDGSV